MADILFSYGVADQLYWSVFQVMQQKIRQYMLWDCQSPIIHVSNHVIVP